ncbi:MAG: hypothetical protein SPI30_01350 [Prevotella sp.]|nr:hypothetical protein [Prevotella sp.]
MTGILPTFGRACTNAWYGSYQSLVHTVPNTGTMAGGEDLHAKGRFMTNWSLDCSCFILR